MCRPSFAKHNLSLYNLELRTYCKKTKSHGLNESENLPVFAAG